MQEGPIVEQLSPVEFRSGLGQAPLWDRQVTAEQLESVDRKGGRVILVDGVEMRTMVACAGLGEHANDYSVETRDLGHAPQSCEPYAAEHCAGCRVFCRLGHPTGRSCFDAVGASMWQYQQHLYAVATFALRKKSAGIGRRNFHTNAIGRSPLCDT